MALRGLDGRRQLATLVLVSALAALGLADSALARGTAPPRPGPWKILAAHNTARGVLVVTGQAIGKFTVTRHRTVTGFRLTFAEEGENGGCAGGSIESPRSGSISIPGRDVMPIVHVKGRGVDAWEVVASAGSLGGNLLQPLEVQVIQPNGAVSNNSMVELTLATNKGLRSGDVQWAKDSCGVAFVVKPG
jgi:hypothetical protein